MRKRKKRKEKGFEKKRVLERKFPFFFFFLKPRKRNKQTKWPFPRGVFEDMNESRRQNHWGFFYFFLFWDFHCRLKKFFFEGFVAFLGFVEPTKHTFVRSVAWDPCFCFFNFVSFFFCPFFSFLFKWCVYLCFQTKKFSISLRYSVTFFFRERKEGLSGVILLAFWRECLSNIRTGVREPLGFFFFSSSEKG